MCFSILSVNGPLNEKRLKWMSSTGGNRESESILVALRSVLQRGQFLCVNESVAVKTRRVISNNQPSVGLFHDFSPDKCIETLLDIDLAGLGRWYRQG